MIEQEITKAIIEIAKSEGVDPAGFAIREVTSVGSTKAGMPKLLKHLAGQHVFLYSLSRDADLREWLSESGWQHRNIDCADLFWRAL